MDDKVVVLRVAEHLLSLPFIHVDEILSADRVKAASDIPEDSRPDDAAGALFVLSRERWVSARKLFPDQEVTDRSQIVVLTCDQTETALMVDQVVGIEKSGVLAPLPEVVAPYLDIPFAGVRFLKDRPVLELDLSRLISLDRGESGIG